MPLLFGQRNTKQASDCQQQLQIISFNINLVFQIPFFMTQYIIASKQDIICYKER